jgi:hypothetical protein
VKIEDRWELLFNSSSFANRVSDDAHVSSFTVMMGARHSVNGFTPVTTRSARLFKLELFQVLGILEPLAVKIHRWPQALPQYSAGLPTVWEESENNVVRYSG